MNRAPLGAGGLACLAMVACGSAAASVGSTPSASPSTGGRAGFARNAAFGQLVQINGSTLILSGTAGDSTVTYAATTTITQTSTGTLANITPGICIAATGTKNAAGMMTASTVLLSAPAKGSCATTGFGAGAGGSFSPRPGATPRPSFSPPAGIAGLTAARGQVKAVTGTSVTLTATNGITTTINVPTTVKVTTSTVIQAAALQTGECVTALGPKNSSGTVAARSLTITPAGANGCTAGFGGGFGRGGGFGGGFGGGGGGGSSGA
jgi:hypothetical protein